MQISSVVHAVRVTLAILLVLVSFDSNLDARLTTAQEIATAATTTTTGGDVVCSCSPSAYTFVLDFGLSCPPANITTGAGVASVACLISPFGAPTDKLAPIVVESVSILELDQENNVLVEERVDGELFDGDSFSYSSVINNPEEMTSDKETPKALQLNLSGRNENGVLLMNVFVIAFSNECGVVPVIRAGESAGWAIFVSLSVLVSKYLIEYILTLCHGTKLGSCCFLLFFLHER